MTPSSGIKEALDKEFHKKYGDLKDSMYYEIYKEIYQDGFIAGCNVSDKIRKFAGELQ